MANILRIDCVQSISKAASGHTSSSTSMA